MVRRFSINAKFNSVPNVYLNNIICITALLTFRVLRSNRKALLKYIHGGIQFLTLPLIVIGLVAVFDSHNFNIPPTPNLYSLHSWIGLGAVILFFLQVRIGSIIHNFTQTCNFYQSHQILLFWNFFSGWSALLLSYFLDWVQNTKPSSFRYMCTMESQYLPSPLQHHFLV